MSMDASSTELIIQESAKEKTEVIIACIGDPHDDDDKDVEEKLMLKTQLNDLEKQTVIQDNTISDLQEKLNDVDADNGSESRTESIQSETEAANVSQRFEEKALSLADEKEKFMQELIGIENRLDRFEQRMAKYEDRIDQILLPLSSNNQIYALNSLINEQKEIQMFQNKNTNDNESESDPTFKVQDVEEKMMLKTQLTDLERQIELCRYAISYMRKKLHDDVESDEESEPRVESINITTKAAKAAQWFKQKVLSFAANKKFKMFSNRFIVDPTFRTRKNDLKESNLIDTKVAQKRNKSFSCDDDDEISQDHQDGDGSELAESEMKKQKLF